MATVYATQADIEEAYTADALILAADRDNDGVADAAVVSNALTDASAEIDTYVATKYQLPLATVPRVLVLLCVDIALYRLSAAADIFTDERRQRYEDAVRLLKRISTGEVSLGIPQPPKTTNGVVIVQSKTRRFKRNS